MLGYLILLFTILPALELYLLIKIGTVIGAGNTIFIIILTGVIGATMARFQGFLVLSKIQHNLNKGLMPNAELIDGLLILVGGIVLLTPGFITDVFGFLLLLPWTRNMIKRLLRKKFESMIREGEVIQVNRFGNRFKDLDDYDDIDVN